MGLLRKMALMTMPVMRFEETGRGIMAAAGLSPDKVEQIVREHRTEMLQYRKDTLCSATKADAYMSQVVQSWRKGELGAGWKKLGAYFCLFCWTAGDVALRIYHPPFEYIMRTGDSIWQACEVPEEMRDTMNDQLKQR